MIDHVSIAVQDFKEAIHFYEETLKLLGYQKIHTFDYTVGFGKNDKSSFWIIDRTSGKEEEPIGKARSVHIAFTAPTSESIHAWHVRCQELGGTDNGKPGERPRYHKGYYSGFIIDPNGWRIEAVMHDYRR